LSWNIQSQESASAGHGRGKGKKGKKGRGGVGKLAMGIVNKVKVKTFDFSKKLGLILFFVWRKVTREALVPFLLSAWNHGKL
jgi:hypothetical protein